ncbi:enoyl-CoA hydratase [Williamsia deligens]|uniref:Enoyl-CoA hydratase n=1 Tax=Williamsia deligens TaxID=321325 RepID=A0ABW3G531_9NOCA|nr:enoyl-CoA hydratase [Williamsia deligens]MCP2193895.1 hypothetical protein [Williamsia deligens]
MRMPFRSFIAATAVVAAAVTGGVVASGPAGAAPPPRDLPRFTVLGDNYGMFGDHDFCRGSVNVRLTSPKRSVTRATITSNGFTGDGPGWAKNPRCRVLIGLNFTSASAYAKEILVPASFGRAPGEKVVRDVVTGSGLVLFGANAYSTNTPVRLPQAYGTNWYILVP